MGDFNKAIASKGLLTMCCGTQPAVGNELFRNY